MCDKCSKGKKFWVHISDGWTGKEKKEMLFYIVEDVNKEFIGKDDIQV